MWYFYLFQQVTELECVSSQANAVHTHKTELNQTIQELESTLKKKEEVFATIYSWIFYCVISKDF